MKRTILLITAFAGLVLTTLSSNSSGPASNGNGDRTGRINPSRTCGAAGCHGALSGDIAVTVTLKDKITGQTLAGGYVPGNEYEVQLDAVNGVNVNTRFGFQTVTVKANNTQGGSFNAAGLNPLYHIINSGGLQFLEHSQPISGSGSTYSVVFDWTAPAAGSGPVTLWAIFNSVNGNGLADAGDRPSMPFSTTIPEAPTGIASVDEEQLIRVYPNPATDYVRIELQNAERGIYHISVFDLAGKQLYHNEILINLDAAAISMETSGWAPGMYAVRIAGAHAQWTVPLVRK